MVINAITVMPKKHVKIGEWKKVFQGKLFTIEQAKVQLPDGRIDKYERAIRPPSVDIIAFDSKNRLLLNYEYRADAKKFLYGFPAGRIEDGETPKQAACRELMEEAGYYPKKIKLFYKTKPASTYSYISYTFIARDLTPKKLEGGEFEDIKTVRVSLSKAYQMVKKEQLTGRETMRAICKLYWNRKKLLKWTH